MSGAEFVAILSIGASVIAVVDACNKLRNRVKEFEDDDTLRQLAAELRLFSNGIEILRQQHTDEDLDAVTQDALIEVLTCCEKRIKELDALIASALPAQRNTGVQRVRAAIRNLRDNKRVRYILDSLQRCQQLLVFHMASVSRRQQLDKGRGQQGIYQESVRCTARLDDSFGLCRPQEVIKERLRRSAGPTPTQSCVRGNCGCACHRMTIRLGFVSFNLPFPFLSRCTCIDTTIGVSVFAMHRILAFNVSVAWMDGISIGTALKMVSTVPYSSPGLTVLAKFSAGVIGSAETIETLSTLRGNNLIDFNEATMNNEGYLERALKESKMSLREPKAVIDVVRYLTGQGVKWRSPRPISVCLKYIERCYTHRVSEKELFASVPPFELNNGHMFDFDFSTYVSMLGFDGAVHSLRAAFEISKSDNIYGGTPDLHYTVITGTLDEVMALIEEKPGSQHRHSDVFGHSALHVAVTKPQILAYLLRNGFVDEIEARDHFGMTPLIYAAATKQLTSAKLLLDYGANPWESPMSDFSHRDSIFWAARCALQCRDPSAFTELLDHYLASVSPRQALNVVDHCLERLASEEWLCERGDERGTLTAIFMYLLRLGADPNQVETNTFLENAKEAARTKLLHSTPRKEVKHQNLHGYTLLMALSRFAEPHLVSAFLDAGADAKIKDEQGSSALHHAFEALTVLSFGISWRYHLSLVKWPPLCSSSFTWEDGAPRNTIALSALLTCAGTSLLEGDSCMCYCSPGGCTPLQTLIGAPRVCGTNREMLLYQLPWVLELSLVMEACGIPGILQEAVRIVVRRRLFGELEMTHTCCTKMICNGGTHCGNESCYDCGSFETVDWSTLQADMAEIQEEEEELSKQLESKVRDTKVFSSCLNNNQLLSELAGWAVELEARPVAYMELVEGWLYPSKAENIESLRRRMTSISHDPPLSVENSSGDIIHLPKPHSLKTWTASDFINVYLEDLRKHPDYLDDFVHLGIDSAALTLRREALAKQLMEEIDRLQSR